MSEKTEKPTAQRLRDAREKGRIAQSRLFSASAVTLVGLAGFFASTAASLPALKAWTTRMLSARPEDATHAVHEAIALFAALAAPPLACAFVAALIVSVAAAGLHMNPGHVSPQLERVDPFKGFARLFSSQKLAEVAKGLAVALLMTALLWSDARDAAAAVVTATQRPGLEPMAVAVTAVQPALLRGAVVLVLLGVGDYLLARRRHLRDLMMSRDQVKREFKSSEGDPHHKAKRKQLHQQLAAGGPARGVHKATAVVVNPTHIAVAVRYDELECDAPYIVAKAREEEALKLRKQAEQLDIPVVRDVPLARTLVHYDVGEEVPEELYQAAAALLKVALEKKNGGKP